MHQDQPLDYNISLVSVESHFDQMLPLMRSHFNEVSYHTEFEFGPNKKLYMDMEANGHLKLIIVKSNDEIIGYATYFLTQHPHVDILQAHQDSIYLDPSYRKHGIGAALLSFADVLFKSLGAAVVFVAVTEKYDYSKSLIPMGYKLVDKLYARRL